MCKKIENYVNYINNNRLINKFPDVCDLLNVYYYKI